MDELNSKHELDEDKKALAPHGGVTTAGQRLSVVKRRGKDKLLRKQVAVSKVLAMWMNSVRMC
jgi:hypothetical protein